MKIISNNDVYIQGSDLEQILQNDKTFPLDMYYAIAKGMPHVKSLTKFIKIEGEKEKDFLKRNTIIPDFGDLYTCTIEELEEMIKRLKKEEWDIICSDDTLGRDQTAEERIESYKRKKKIDYLLVQIREMVAYKRGKSMLDYPNIPNPGHRVFEIGELKATLSLQNGKIICYPKKGKKSGAYSWGCYDSYPYLLTNYENDLDSLSTLAHELGHSVHSYYSKNNQIYEYANYPIFLAEIASTVNEILLNEYLYQNATDKNEKILYLSEFLDKVRATIYRQTMFAEFEMIMHQKEKEGIPLTEKEFSDTYYNLNKLYYGKNVISDEEIRYEWMRIPHFYTSFYVYKYATGLSCAIYIAYEILKGNQEVKENYIKFLKSGSNGYPLDILKLVGIDLTTGEVVADALKVFKDKLCELKKLI